MRIIFCQEFFRKMEISRGSKPGNITVSTSFFRKIETISANNLLVFRIPNDQLFLSISFSSVKFININLFPCASSGMSEGNLSYPANLVHQRRRIIIIKYINLIVTIVGLTQKLITGQFSNNLILW